ncbi:RraA family protein [Lutibacter maritimus]|uniref:hypothetical protein n=1 Tax=Lutibacter maritimus TaxID=593133 RepID=UPI000A90A8D9|nr:hypothetical protein [Lutibacter maritimus]
MYTLSITTKQKLQKVSSATIATCLFKRGFKNQFIQNVKPLKLGKPTMVGTAFTSRYIPAREDLNTISAFKDPKHPQRIAVEECPEGSVLRNNARAASPGSILVTQLIVEVLQELLQTMDLEIRPKLLH